MKKLLGFFAMVALTIGAQANCGVKVTDEGKIKSYDAEKKTVVVEKADGKTATITLTPATKGAEKLGESVGKSVTVISEHGKADSVAVKS